MRPKLDIGCILASGFSRRFGTSNKLLEPIDNKPMIHWSVQALRRAGYQDVHAIIPEGDTELRTYLETENVDILDNGTPALGQSHSVRLAASLAIEMHAKSLMIVLGDMPFIPAAHLTALQKRLRGHDAVMSAVEQMGRDLLLPPVIFAPQAYTALLRISGDKGAKTVFDALQYTQTVYAASDVMRDIDTPKALRRITDEVEGKGRDV